MSYFLDLRRILNRLGTVGNALSDCWSFGLRFSAPCVEGHCDVATKFEFNATDIFQRSLRVTARVAYCV